VIDISIHNAVEDYLKYFGLYSKLDLIKKLIDNGSDLDEIIKIVNIEINK